VRAVPALGEVHVATTPSTVWFADPRYGVQSYGWLDDGVEPPQFQVTVGLSAGEVASWLPATTFSPGGIVRTDRPGSPK